MANRPTKTLVVQVVYKRTKVGRKETEMLTITRPVRKDRGGQVNERYSDADLEMFRDQLLAGFLAPRRAIPKKSS
jgi:hypothetical protein